MNPLGLIIEIFEKGENKVVKIFMFLYLIIMNIIISSYIGELIHFNYSGNKITIESILLLISTKQIVLMIFLFLISVGVTIYFVRVATFILAIIFWIIYFFLNKRGIIKPAVFFVLKIFKVITPDNKRNKNFSELIDMNNTLGNYEKNKNFLNFMDFLCSIFIVTLFAFEIWIFGKYFPNWLDYIIGFILWSINIYWILNVSLIKLISGEIQKIESLILEIKE